MNKKVKASWPPVPVPLCFLPSDKRQPAALSSYCTTFPQSQIAALNCEPNKLVLPWVVVTGFFCRNNQKVTSTLPEPVYIDGLTCLSFLSISIPPWIFLTPFGLKAKQRRAWLLLRWKTRQVSKILARPHLGKAAEQRRVFQPLKLGAVNNLGLFSPQ